MHTHRDPSERRAFNLTTIRYSEDDATIHVKRYLKASGVNQ